MYGWFPLTLSNLSRVAGEYAELQTAAAAISP
jgi:hypothetical protein